MRPFFLRWFWQGAHWSRTGRALVDPRAHWSRTGRALVDPRAHWSRTGRALVAHW